MADNNSTQNREYDLQLHNAVQDARISNLETKFEMFMQSMKESNDKRDAEMRDRDNQRHAEIAELRNSIKEIYQTTDAKVAEIRNSIQTMQNQNVIVIIGVIAIAVAVFLK